MTSGTIWGTNSEDVGDFSSSCQILISQDGNGSTDAVFGSTSVSIDTSLYRYARIRFRFKTLISNPIQNLEFSWIRDGESSYETALRAPDVDLYVNGDDYHELVWDMENDKNISGGTSAWSGTVTGIKFSFLDNPFDWGDTSVEVDWVRFEPGYLNQGV